MINKITNSITKEKEVDEAITRALEALENRDYMAAIEEAHNALSISEYIEQRLCLLAIRNVATLQDEDKTIELLEEAYNY